MENEIFNELFNTFLSPASTIEDCLKSVNWLTSDNSSSSTMNGDHRQPEAATTRVKVEQYDDTTIGSMDQDDDDDDDQVSLHEPLFTCLSGQIKSSCAPLLNESLHVE
eukprot:sb/3477580/